MTISRPIYAGEQAPAQILERVLAEVAESGAVMTEMNAAVREYRARTQEELGGVSARLQAVEQLVAMGHQARQGVVGGAAIGSIAVQALAESSAFAHLIGGNLGTARVPLNASIRAALTTEGWGSSSDTTTPSVPGFGGYVGEARPRLRLLDALPKRQVTSDSWKFVRLSRTGDADEQLQHGDAKAELQFAGEEAESPIVTIAGWTAASRQVLQDHAALGALIEITIRNRCLNKLEEQIVSGPGGQGRIEGLINAGAAFVSTSGWATADILGEAATELSSNGYEPRLIALHPEDLLAIRAERSSENYVMGPPSAPGSNSLWGVPMLASAAVPQGQALVMDTQFITVLDREAASVMISNSHEDFFTRNKVAILGEVRAGLELLDEFACLVVDLSSSSV
jgi:hypothetical protein